MLLLNMSSAMALRRSFRSKLWSASGEGTLNHKAETYSVREASDRGAGVQRRGERGHLIHQLPAQQEEDLD